MCSTCYHIIRSSGQLKLPLSGFGYLQGKTLITTSFWTSRGPNLLRYCSGVSRKARFCGFAILCLHMAVIPIHGRNSKMPRAECLKSYSHRIQISVATVYLSGDHCATSMTCNRSLASHPLVRRIPPPTTHLPSLVLARYDGLPSPESMRAIKLQTPCQSKAPTCS
jgi:hypothetical protein